MYSDWAGPALVGLLVVWLLGLTFWIFKQGNFLKSLFPKTGERDIRVKFEEVIKQVGNFKEDFEELKMWLSKIEDNALTHIQKIEMLRYNPYDDTGGDQSFSLALIDRRGNGIVLTSLHARSGTRVFAKPVTGGKTEKYQFSKEEELVIKKALES